VVPDNHFADPRLAAIYDDLDDDRSDLDHYVQLVFENGARTVLDVGCGTGSLACRLAELGLNVTGVDPAEASLDVARASRSPTRFAGYMGPQLNYRNSQSTWQ
jgi:2-polyprenyl-3-methyl-5-hydroxy-6-metoxy-1,4-benzoquinol methylase